MVHFNSWNESVGRAITSTIGTFNTKAWDQGIGLPTTINIRFQKNIRCGWDGGTHRDFGIVDCLHNRSAGIAIMNCDFGGNQQFIGPNMHCS